MTQSEFDTGVEKLLDKDFTEWVKNECTWDEAEYYYHIKTELKADVPFELYEMFMRLTKPVLPKKEDYTKSLDFDNNAYSTDLDEYMTWVDARKKANKQRFLALVSPEPSTWEADYKRRKRKRFWNKLVLRYLIAKDYIKMLFNIKDNG